VVADVVGRIQFFAGGHVERYSVLLKRRAQKKP
jgi:hypothetical protein